MRPLLITIPFSHYNERARWALDRFGIGYDEERYPPMFHFLGTLRASWRSGAGRADRASTRLSTPMLVLADRTLTDSGDILRYANAGAAEDATLYPAAERAAISRFEQEVHDGVGPHTRRCAYWEMTQHPETFDRVVRATVDPPLAAAAVLLRPLTMRAIVRALGVGRARVERSLQRLDAFFERVGEMLGDREYLFAERFTAADLTFASLAAPILFPIAEYGADVSSVTIRARELVEPARRLRDSRAGRHALRMFERERGQRVPASSS